MTKAEMNALKSGDRVKLAWGDIARVSQYRYLGTSQTFPILVFTDGDMCALSAFRAEDIKKL